MFLESEKTVFEESLRQPTIYRLDLCFATAALMASALQCSNHPARSRDVQKTASLNNNNKREKRFLLLVKLTLYVSTTAGWIQRNQKTQKVSIWSCASTTGRNKTKATQKKRKEKDMSRVHEACWVEIDHFSSMWPSWLNYCKTNKCILPWAALGKWQPAHACKSFSVGAHLFGEVSAGSCLVEATEPENCGRSLKGESYTEEYTVKKNPWCYTV